MAPCQRAHAEQTSLTSAQHPQKNAVNWSYYTWLGCSGGAFFLMCTKMEPFNLCVGRAGDEGELRVTRSNTENVWQMSLIDNNCRAELKSRASADSSKSSGYHIYFPCCSGFSSSARNLILIVLVCRTLQLCWSHLGNPFYVYQASFFFFFF